jgi:hypothetical protein
MPEKSIRGADFVHNGIERASDGDPQNERAHNLKEAKGRAGTVRSNQRSSNTLYCRVNVRVNNEVRRDSCSSSLINLF